WNNSDSTLTVKTGIVPIPADYQRALKMDFLTYNGSPSDPVAPSKNWSPIGKNTWDAHQMFFASPLTKTQMANLGFDTTLTTNVRTEYNKPIPEKFELLQNYPNPFNPETKIEFHLPKGSIVTLKVYNILGHEVQTLLNKHSLPAGIHTVRFESYELPSGLYIYKLDTDGKTLSRKMLLMK
ncbi:MAG: T9SS type A sorting domain-containing protein, partial [Ignavibacteriales bacterium]|nr:T9SS type A sorting domain-containing protein [Ignavibacteriales bacterium]